jgi:hypothetical protein
MSVLFSPRFQAVDANGNPYSGAQLFFYQSGTTTPITTYADSGASTPSTTNVNGAVEADSAGKFAAIFLTTNPFKFVLKSEAGAVLDSADAIPLNDAAALLTDFNVTDSETITKVDATAAVGPYLDLYRNSASPAASDLIGEIRFTGKDDGGNTTTYAAISGTIADPTNASEDGTLLLKAMVAGTLTTRATISASGVTLATPLAATSGGSGTATYAQGDILYASATDTLSKLTKGAALTKLRMNAGGTVPEWAADTVSNPGSLFGLTLSNNGSDATNDIDIATGIAADSTNADTITLAAGLTKRLDAAWAVGTNQGGLDTGSIANATYHVYLIKRPDTGVVDAIFSTSASAPTLPTSYTLYRRIGSIVRTGAAIKAFFQEGDYFYWSVQASDIAANNPGTAAVTATLTVPVGIRVLAVINAGFTDSDTAGAMYFLITALDQTDTTPSATAFIVGHPNEVGGKITPSTVTQARTNTSGQVRYRISQSDASVTAIIQTLGWIDGRGRAA